MFSGEGDGFGEQARPEKGGGPDHSYGFWISARFGFRLNDYLGAGADMRNQAEEVSGGIGLGDVDGRHIEDDIAC